MFFVVLSVSLQRQLQKLIRVLVDFIPRVNTEIHRYIISNEITVSPPQYKRHVVFAVQGEIIVVTD